MRKIDLSNVKSKEEIVTELREFVEAGSLTLLVGAGISKAAPTSFPLAGELVYSTCRSIAQKLDIPLDALLTHDGKVMRLEPFLRLIEVFCSTYEMESYLEIFRSGKPNINHYAIARILAISQDCQLINLNFDYMIEKALQMFQITSSAIVATEELVKKIYPIKDRDSQNLVEREIYKPHGTLIENQGSEGIVATVQTIGEGLPPVLKDRLNTCIDQKVLFVTGYSDDDIDIFPLLCSAEPRTVYWNTLHDKLPRRVEEWFLEDVPEIAITHLQGPCELIFEHYLQNVRIGKDPKRVDGLSEFTDNWVKNMRSRTRIAAIAAWLAQDRHRVSVSKQLYLEALRQSECESDRFLCRFVRYRYAELLRHQAEEKWNASREYLRVFWSAFYRPADIPMIIVTIRSLASACRSIAHRSRGFTNLAISFVAVLMLFVVRFMTWALPEYQWHRSVFARDKDGTWLNWEMGMISFGSAHRVWWPKILAVTLLSRALLYFERAEGSKDLYERSAAVFGQARTLLALGHLSDTSHNQKLVNEKIDAAEELFRIFDDVTGLENISRLREAVDRDGLDPWLS